MLASAKGLEWPVVIAPDLARVIPSSFGAVVFDPALGVALDFGDEDGEPVLYRLIVDKNARLQEDELRRLFYVAPTRARDHLILTSTHGRAGNRCGLGLLAPGLELAGIECSGVPVRQEDAVPPELPVPSLAEPPGLLLGSVG